MLGKEANETLEMGNQMGLIATCNEDEVINKFINTWNLHPGFKEFVCEKWNSYVIEGWGGYILKGKLNLKLDIKKWNIETFGLLEKSIEERKSEIFKLDLFDDVFGLEPEDNLKRNEESAILFSDYKCLDNLLQQKAICKWIADGDANTKKFHWLINKRRKNNEIT
ncbi:hypothetical protein ACS0TY_029479 [Phlomoides rotata]